MILLAGADLVLPDRVLPAGSLLIDGDRIVAIEPRVVETPHGATRVDCPGGLIVPGFIDVHVHGVEGDDVLDDEGAIGRVAARLPKYGVTSFCPTSVACDPHVLRRMLSAVAAAAGVDAGVAAAARVLPAHLESNFINPAFNGAQPLECLRRPRPETTDGRQSDGSFAGDEILAVIDAAARSVGIVTVAPELDGGLDLVRRLVRGGHRVSIGHSGATYEQTHEAIDAGVSHATHLFNRMSPMSHRAPGVPGAVLESERVRVELIADGFHVHPAMMALAIRAKGPSGIMAITDGTAGSGLPVGSRARLGGRPITVTERSAELEDGTLAGSVLTMDGAFRRLCGLGIPVLEAAHMCATTPADQLGRSDLGRVTVGAVADVVVLDQTRRVQSTFIAGQLWRNPARSGSV